jgi:hypothetical protein
LAIFKKMLEKNFPGRDELVKQLMNLSVRQLDDEGSLALSVSSSVRAPVCSRIPVEASYEDSDGLSDEAVKIHVLLHVVEGQMVELEIYKDDGSQITKKPNCDDLQIN